MRLSKWAPAALAVVVAATALSTSVAVAKKGGGGGNGGGGGGAPPAYTIVDLTGPYHAVDGWSQTYAYQIADVAGSGPIYVLGTYLDSTNGSTYPPCVWTIDETGVAVADISGLLDTLQDINSAGIIGGSKDSRPALLLPNGHTVFLMADEEIAGDVLGLNNPDGAGVFQAVGYHRGGPLTPNTPVIWDVGVEGTVLAVTNLIDSNGDGFFAQDINDGGVMGGAYWDSISLESVPAVGGFHGGQLQISLRPNPNPAAIEGFRGYQLDDGENLLGFGYQLGEVGTISRAVIWPAAGDAIDLGAETGIPSTEGNGIALVDGVMQAVGRASGDGQDAHACLYTNNKLSDLNPTSSGDQKWTLSSAEGVNTAGMICGRGRVGTRRNWSLHGFLLVPNTQ